MRHPKPMPRIGRPITRPGPIGDLARLMPSVDALIKELGDIDASTLRRYANGQFSIPGPIRKLLEGLFQKYRINERPW